MHRLMRGTACKQLAAHLHSLIQRAGVPCAAEGVRLRAAAGGRGLQLTWACMQLPVGTFYDLDGEGPPCFLRARHPRAWGAARSSNLMSLKKARSTGLRVNNKENVTCCR